MNDWIDRLDIILQMNGRELLTHAGEISHKMALEKSVHPQNVWVPSGSGRSPRV